MSVISSPVYSSQEEIFNWSRWEDNFYWFDNPKFWSLATLMAMILGIATPLAVIYSFWGSSAFAWSSMLETEKGWRDLYLGIASSSLIALVVSCFLLFYWRLVLAGRPQRLVGPETYFTEWIIARERLRQILLPKLLAVSVIFGLVSLIGFVLYLI